MAAPTRSPAPLPRTILRATVLAVVALAPLPFGAVGPLAVWTLQAVGLVAGAGAVWLLALHAGIRPAAPRWLVALPLALVVVGALQTVPLPEAVRAPLLGELHALRAAVAGLGDPALRTPPSLSSTPAETLDALLRLLAWVGLGAATAVAFRRRRQLRVLAWTVAASATVQALYGSWEYLSGRDRILGHAKRYYLDDATGTFVNRNHFANFLAVSLPFVWILVLAAVRDGEATGGWRRRVLAWTRRRTIARWVALACIALVWIGLALSHSRAGLVAALLGSAVLWVAAGRPRRLAVAALAVVLVPAAFVATREDVTTGERFGRIDENLRNPGGRPAVWRASARIVGDAPLLGVGLGSYEWIFPLYRPPGVTAHWDHAHNDWLQLAVEGGGVGFVLAAAFLVGLLRFLARGTATDADAIRYRAACAAALVTMAFHAAFDFSLRIPANAALFAVVCGASLAAGGLVPPERTRPFRPRKASRDG